MIIGSVFGYGYIAFWFFWILIALSLGDDEVSEKERWFTALGLALVWPFTYTMFLVWESKEKRNK